MHFDATKGPYRYLLIDLKQDTANEDQLRISVMKECGNCNM